MEALSLRELRREIGKTLSEMADATGVSVACLSRMETQGSVPRRRCLESVAKGYGLSSAQLIERIFAENAILPNPPKGPTHLGVSDLRNVHGSDAQFAQGPAQTG